MNNHSTTTTTAVSGYGKADVKSYIKILEAYLRGETIQCKFLSTDDWESIDQPTFNFGSCQYRIAPEVVFRPIADHEEFRTEVRYHGGYVRPKSSPDVTCQITSFDATSVIIDTMGHICPVTYSRLLELYTWAFDNQPCGIGYEA